MKLNRLLKIGEFEVDRHGLGDMQILLLAIAIDPSEKQRQVLDAFGIEIYDYNGKKIYPSPSTLGTVTDAQVEEPIKDTPSSEEVDDLIRELEEEELDDDATD